MALTLALLEGSSIFAALCAALVMRHPLPGDWVTVVAGLGEALGLALSAQVAFYYSDLYDFRVVPSFPAFVGRLARGVGLTVLQLAAFYALFPASGPGFVWSAGAIVGLPLAIRAVAYAAVGSGLFKERALIVGSGPLARRLVQEIEARPCCRYALVGVVDDGHADGGSTDGLPLLGPIERLDKIVEEVRPDRIIVALAERRGRLVVSHLLNARMRGVGVEEGEEVYERLTGKLAIESLTPSSLIFSKGFRPSPFALAAGRGLSLVVSALGLIGLAPLLGLIALAIKLDSRGPVFFVQERVGLGGRRFKLIKFRTMRPAAGPTSEWAGDNGDRITRVGKWLRKFRLDELPQFVNVLRGDMNLVGPRPHPVSNFELFVLVLRNAPECGTSVPYYALRSLVPPGITGWAQVRYRYANDLEEEIEKMRYDLYYVKHLSLWLDLRILFETAKVVLFGRETVVAAAEGTEVRGWARRLGTLRKKLDQKTAA